MMIRPLTYAAVAAAFAALPWQLAQSQTPIASFSESGLGTNKPYASSVKISGPYVLAGVGRGGGAYVYDWTTGLRVTNFGRSSSDFFADAFALQGTKAILETDDEVIIYDFADPSNVQQTPLLTANGTPLPNAYAIDISGDTVLASSGNSAYLFDLATGMEFANFQGDDIVAGDRFGVSVAIEGELAVVGADLHDGKRGAVYSFDASRTTTGDRQIAKYTAPTNAPWDQFGLSVGVNANDQILSRTFYGAYLWAVDESPQQILNLHSSLRADDTPLTETHAAVGSIVHNRVFVHTTDGSLAGVINRPPWWDSYFPYSVDMEGDKIAVGFPTGVGSGSVLVYSLDDLAMLPEPASLGLLSAAGFVMAASRRRRPSA